MTLEKDFILIGITQPIELQDEGDRIKALLDCGFNMIHVRKPGLSADGIRRVLEGYSPEVYPYLRLHDHFELAREYGLNGVHLNKRNPVPCRGVGSISRSCHTISELDAEWPEIEGCSPTYQTLSPIFDSISKRDYKSAFDLEGISTEIEGKKVVALGGVDHSKLNLLESVNFIGAAMLGAIWK